MTASGASEPGAKVVQREQCDHCGSEDVDWVKCKLICRNCRRIVKSCADLSAPG